MPDRRWNLSDTALVLDNPSIPDAELAARLRGRGTSEVARLRDALHAGHDPGATVASNAFGLITEPIAGLLSKRGHADACARCGRPMRQGL